MNDRIAALAVASRSATEAPASSLRNLLNADPIGSIGNHDLGVLTVAKITMEDADAVAPMDPIARTPNPGYLGPRSCRPPISPLTCLARLAAWQSLGTGHYLRPPTKPFTLPLPTAAARAEGGLSLRQLSLGVPLGGEVLTG
ncbi:MAG TPA: hypothetical protein VE687_09220 [Stellaceae bacterium]|nr:hypothetical protein [Stellaceae bacterium]